MSACSGYTSIPVSGFDSETNFGAILDPTEFAAVTNALAPQAFATGPTQLPSRVVLPNLPTVSAQGVGSTIGSPGTCEAQSFGYGLGSYTAAQTAPGVFRWSPDDPSNLISPAWLFAWSVANKHSTCPKGGRAIPYLQLLVESGAPSLADVPYNPHDDTTPAEMCAYFASISLSTPYPDSSRFQIGGYYALERITASSQSSTLPLLKAFLAAGFAVAFSGLVAPGYAKISPPLTDDVFYLNGTASGGHGQLLVGFDDTIGSTSDPGAFLVQNSFGSNWNPGSLTDPGRNGRVWYSYSSWFSTQSLAAIAVPLSPDATPGTVLTDDQGGTAPTVSILRAHDWNDSANGRHVLVLVHRFGAPLRLQHLSVTDPTGATFDQDHGGSSRTGYTYAQRTDGAAFSDGAYSIRLSVQTVSGVDVVYSGTVNVPTS